MENYTKGEVKVVEDPYPFSVDDALQMRITQGSKIRNVMGFAMKKMGDKQVRQITWNGSDSSVSKAITCAEIMKRKLKNLHQITKIRFKRIEEHWVPKVEGLEPLKVNRDIPAISILLSKDPLDASEPGYQAPGNFEGFWQEHRQQADNKPGAGRRRPRSRKFSGQQESKDGGQQHHPKTKKAQRPSSNSDSAAKAGES
ncbi:ribonuclease P protein subunit p25-like protein [Babylonia areolata]|uniref:ribonuclease P protein subunit p25-like protein n=1 Tax=Babylonia areolata TaxID=304850 RepID=UPI003FD221B9